MEKGRLENDRRQEKMIENNQKNLYSNFFGYQK